MAKPGRPGAAKGKKGATVGTGGHGKDRLAGKGPTPKAEDRKNHKAYKAKQAAAKHREATGAKRAIAGKTWPGGGTSRLSASKFQRPPAGWPSSIITSWRRRISR